MLEQSMQYPMSNVTTAVLIWILKLQDLLYPMGFKLNIKLFLFPFPNGTNQKWHFKLGRKYFNEKNVEVEVQSQTFDRDNPCEVCQTTEVLLLNDITIEKRIELLPYVAGNLRKTE